ncbi:MAG: hypothetical protein KKC99_03795, partial [Proteobacteria bacterium]|nr:hypothetical protein [Pseudomonadota bacterium]
MSTTVRAALYYLLSIGLMTFYGGRVCPFIDSLPIWTWLSVMVVGYVLAFGVRTALEPRFVLGAELWSRGRRQFWLEMVTATLLGIGVTAYDTLVFSFPIASGLKALLGIWCFGFFMALDLTLVRERAMALKARETNVRLDPKLPFHSLTRKIVVLATIWTAFNTMIIALVVFKDIAYLHDFMQNMLQSEALSAVKEILFVGLVLLAFTIRIVVSYARNLRLSFELQAEVLEAVGGGELARYVPVVSTDE